mmetsp:Transcript_14940/g.29349  ORF Transcript_14940/g.29349 Transcript_14940/m.29349 type:complete len:212 (+) Transcript_14940:73-708(+)
MGGTVSLTDKLFKAIDNDGSGGITKAELADWFGHKIPHLSERDKENMLSSIGEGKEMSREEFNGFFKRWTADQLESASATIVRLHNMVHEVEDIFDEQEDTKGYIERGHLVALLNPTHRGGIYDKQLRGLFRLLDPQNTGAIETIKLSEEFLRHYKLASRTSGVCPCILCEFAYDEIYKRAHTKGCCGCGNQLKYLDRALEYDPHKHSDKV